MLFTAAGGTLLFERSDDSLATLPPLHVDPDGRHTSWIILASAPGMWYWPHDSNDIEDQFFMEVDEAWFEHQLTEFARMTEHGYAPPIRINHQPAGRRNGFVVKLAVWNDPLDGADKLLAAVTWTIPNAAEDIAAGSLAYTSPGFSTFADDSGHLYVAALNEVSICDSPYQKHICGGRNRHILNSESPMAEPNETPAEGTQLAEMDKNALAAIVKAEMDRYWSDPDSVIADMIAKAIEQQMALKESKGDDTEDPEDSMDEETPKDDDEDPKMVALSERVRQLEQQNAALEEEKARAQFAANYPMGHTITLTEELVDTMYALSKADRESLAKLAESAQAPATPAPGVQLSQQTRTPATPMPTVPWGKRFGSPAGSPSDSDAAPVMSLSERKRALKAECDAEAGGDANKALKLYTERIKSLT